LQILYYPQIFHYEQEPFYTQYPPFGAKICSNVCPLTLSVPRSPRFSESVARGTDHVQGETSKHISTQSGSYCVYHPTYTPSFVNWGISEDLPWFLVGNIRSRDAFRPIADEGKYLDYDYKFCNLQSVNYSQQSLIRSYKIWIKMAYPRKET